MAGLMMAARGTQATKTGGLGVPVPNPLIGAGEPEDIWGGPDPRPTHDTGIYRPAPDPYADPRMRVIVPETANNLGLPDANAKNNVDTLRRKKYGL